MTEVAWREYATYRSMTTEPFLSGDGPPECSTSTALVCTPEWIWDTNGYYRDLGVSPSATRAQLRMAYYALNGQGSVRLTYVIKQLLDPEVRYHYDRVRLGEVFIDRYVMDAMRRRVQRENSERMRERREQGLVVTDAVEQESEWSLWRNLYGEDTFEPEDDTPEVGLDSEELLLKDLSSPATPFSFSYYLWQTRVTGIEDLKALATWQEHLVRAFSKRGVRTRIAVGLHAHDTSAWTYARIGYRAVVFLNHRETPTADLAERVAGSWAASQPFAPSY